jgi:hypothetical protein
MAWINIINGESASVMRTKINSLALATTQTISSATATLFGLTSPNDNVDSALFSLRNVNYETILTSQSWTVPVGVREVDICLISGGFQGTVSTTNASASGGAAGDIDIFLNIPTTPGGSIPVIVGASNGGSSSFNGAFSRVHTALVTGGAGAVATTGSIGGSGVRHIILAATAVSVDGIFPIPATYCIAGAGSGYTWLSGNSLVGVGGIAGASPTGGTTVGIGSGSMSTPDVGGGGASYNNNGSGKNGGSATTVGCGGGSAGYGGTAGSGAPGAVIIRYYK